MKFSQSGILHNNQTFVSLMQRVIDIIVIVGSLLAAVLYLGFTWKLEQTTAAVLVRTACTVAQASMGQMFILCLPS